MSEKAKSDQVPIKGGDPAISAPRRAIDSSPGGQPSVTGQGKQPQRSVDDARRRAETHRALTAAVKARAPSMGADIDLDQTSREATAKPGATANLPPSEDRVVVGEATPDPAVNKPDAIASGAGIASRQAAPEMIAISDTDSKLRSGEDKVVAGDAAPDLTASNSLLPDAPQGLAQPPGYRAKVYRERAMRDQNHAVRYSGWTENYAAEIRKRRANLRKLTVKSFTSEMIADGVEVNGAFTQETRELGYTVPKLGVILIEAGRNKIDFEMLIVLIRSISSEKHRALGYTPQNLIEIILDLERYGMDFKSLSTLLRNHETP